MQFFRYYDQMPQARRVRFGRAVTVLDWQKAVLLRNGRVAGTLDAGRRRMWTLGASVHVVDMRSWIFQVPTQEIPTADGTTVKITVSARVRVADPVAYVTKSQSPVEAVYLAVQLALRAVLGALTVEEVLSTRPDLLAAVDVDGVAAVGVAVEAVEVKDVILSADLKRAQAEVLVARAHGLAALERARGETAALRSLANAARAAADNPALLQLRLLQELGSTTGNTVVIGMPGIG